MNPWLALLVVCCTATAATPDPRDPILAGWEASRKRLTTVRYTFKGATESRADVNPAGKSATPRPSASPPECQGVILLDLTRRRHRLEDTNPTLSQFDRTKYATQYRVWACDGVTDKSIHPRDKNEWVEGNPDMHISRGDLTPVDFPAEYIPLFVAHGFVPSSRERVGPGHWPAPSDRDEYVAHGTGVIGGRVHTILRGEPWHGFVDEYWADPGRGGAVSRFVIWVDKTDPYMRFDMDYQQVDGVWVLNRWAQTISMGRRVVQSHRYEVTRVEANPVVADTDFDLPVEPGYVVKEHNYPAKGSGLNPAYPANKTTRVRPNGTKDVVAESGFQTYDGVPVPPAVPWWRLWWVWTTCAAVAVIATVWVARRRARVAAARVPQGERG